MDQRERKEPHPSLPPDYVSLAQLQERWLQKQQEKEMREKQAEEEKKQRDAGLNENQKQRGWLKNDWSVKKAGGGPLKDVLRRAGGKNGRERGGAIEGKGKGKEIVIGGFENGEENKRNEKTKKKGSRDRRKKKLGKRSEVEKEKLKSETNKEFDGSEESKIVPGNEAKVGIKGVLSGESSGNGGIHGGLKGSSEEIVNRMDFRGGFLRNGDNWGSGYNSRRQNRVRILYQLKETEVKLPLEKKMEGKKGYSRNWRERRRNGNDREGYYRLKDNGADVLKGNVVEMKLEKKAEDENLEVRSEIGGLNGRDRSKSTDDSRVERVGLNDDNMLALDKKVDEEVLAMESVKIGEKGVVVGNEYRRYGNWRGNNGRRFGGGLAFNDWKAKVGDHRRYARPGRFEGHWKTKEREKSGMMWMKKEDKSEADYDAARVGSYGISEDQE